MLRRALECALLVSGVQSAAADTGLAEAKARLANVARWGCQFQKLDVEQAVNSPLDLIVIDPDAEDSHGRQLSKSDVAALKRKPDGTRRTVLSYLSVGEAEQYRRYWHKGWRTGSPDWIGRENPQWPGSFVVRYWDDGWRQQLFGTPQSALDRILALEFDGVFMDRVDAYSDWLSEKRSAASDMVQLVDDLTRYGRLRQPGLLFIGQNSEELLGNASYLAAIDAVSKESLLYGLSGPGRINTADQIAWSASRLSSARRRGLPILAIEYLDDPEKIATARAKLAKLGFVPFFADRLLDRLP